MGGQYHVPAPLSPGRRPSTHGTDDCVGLAAGLEGTENLAPPRFNPRINLAAAFSSND